MQGKRLVVADAAQSLRFTQWSLFLCAQALIALVTHLRPDYLIGLITALTFHWLVYMWLSSLGLGTGKFFLSRFR